MRALQAVEFLVRSIPHRVLLALHGGARDVPVPDWRARPYRVLVIRDDGIGDLILTMETLRAIAESSPDITVDVLASPQNAAFARTLPFVGDVVVHRRGPMRDLWRTWRNLRRRRYDVVVDGRATISNVKAHTAALMFATGAPWRIGVGNRRNDWVYTVRAIPGETTHITEVIAALASPFGVALHDRDWRPRLSLADADRAAAEQRWLHVGAGRPRVLVNISVGNDERLWRHERYGAVLARLRQRLPRAAIMLTAMPADQRVAEMLAGSVRGAAIPLSFSDVMAAVATADLVITPDTAITHVASGFQTPTLALMRKNTQHWAPYRTPGTVAFGDIGRRLEPGLPEARVVAALDELISRLGHERGWL